MGDGVGMFAVVSEGIHRLLAGVCRGVSQVLGDFSVGHLLAVTVIVMDSVVAAIVFGDGTMVWDTLPSFSDRGANAVAATNFAEAGALQGHPWKSDRCPVGHPWKNDRGPDGHPWKGQGGLGGHPCNWWRWKREQFRDGVGGTSNGFAKKSFEESDSSVDRGTVLGI